MEISSAYLTPADALRAQNTAEQVQVALLKTTIDVAATQAAGVLAMLPQAPGGVPSPFTHIGRNLDARA